jgi:hypothetical protein
VGSLVNPLKAACILSPNWLLRRAPVTPVAQYASIDLF